MRKILSILGLLFCCVARHENHAQVIVSQYETVDVCATNSFRALLPTSTGTDACLMPSTSGGTNTAGIMSVSVWDGRDGGLGWRHGNSDKLRVLYFRSLLFKYNGTQYYATGLKDPDVIIGKSSDDSVFAVVAGILPVLRTDTTSNPSPGVRNKVILLQYKYSLSDSSFKFVRMCGLYGNGAGAIEARSPNVDANSSGKMVLVWSEQSTTPQTISSTISGATLTQTVNATNGNVVSVEGDFLSTWNGTCPTCSCGASRTSESSIKEDLIGVGDELHNLWVNFQNPDVSISEDFSDGSGTSSIKSFAFVRSEDMGQGVYNRKLVLVQVKYGECYKNSHDSYSSQNSYSSYPFRYVFDSVKVGVNTSAPRVASPYSVSSPFSPGECSIVLADSSFTNYTSLVNYDTRIWMLGKRSSAMLNSGVPKNLVITPYVNQYSNFSPAITYFKDSTGADKVNVVWEMSNSAHNLMEKNIVSRLYNIDGTPFSPYYGFINKNIYANQGAPSVSARRLTGYVGTRKPCAYSFYTHFPSTTSNASMGVRAGFSHILPGVRRFNLVRPNPSTVN